MAVAARLQHRRWIAQDRRGHVRDRRPSGAVSDARAGRADPVPPSESHRCARARRSGGRGEAPPAPYRRRHRYACRGDVEDRDDAAVDADRKPRGASALVEGARCGRGCDGEGVSSRAGAAAGCAGVTAARATGSAPRTGAAFRGGHSRARRPSHALSAGKPSKLAVGEPGGHRPGGRRFAPAVRRNAR
jgi:hypothetical protein